MGQVYDCWALEPLGDAVLWLYKEGHAQTHVHGTTDPEY